MSESVSTPERPAVTVVFPMYNCARYVPDLLASFSAQSFGDFEVICVIDGATDDTEELVAAHCRADSRFRYAVRENGGAGAGRYPGDVWALGFQFDSTWHGIAFKACSIIDEDGREHAGLAADATVDANGGRASRYCPRARSWLAAARGAYG